MKLAAFATAAMITFSAVTLAIAQTPGQQAQPPGYVADSQSTYDPREVAGARQAYRAACQGHQSNEFCDCLAAAVAQAMPPGLVRQARTGIGDRLADVGSDPNTPLYNADARSGLDDPDGRIRQVEAHYANTCAQFRR
jgi:hypothetical protein